MRIAIGVIVVLLLAGAWWYVSPRLQPMPAFNTADPTNFNEVGVLYFPRPASGQAQGTFSYDDGSGTTTLNIAMDEYSVCASGAGAVPCMAMSVTFDVAFSGKVALMEGTRTGDSILVRKMRVGAEGEQLRSFEPGSVFIPWPAAIRLIESCQVTMAMQTHALDVYLDLKDGRRVRAVEPTIDEMFAVINRAQPQCGSFPVATE